MHNKIIKKTAVNTQTAPNLADYDSFRTAFTWQNALNELDGLPGGQGINIAHEAVDRHVLHGKADKVALRFIS